MTESEEKAKELLMFVRHNISVFERAVNYLDAYKQDMLLIANQVHASEDSHGEIVNDSIIEKLYDSVQIIDTEYCERISKNVADTLSELKRYDFTTGM